MLTVSTMDLTHGVKAALRPFPTKTALANALGITRSAVSQWTRVPVELVLTIEHLTGVSRHELRPDIYGADLSTKPRNGKRRA